MSLSDDVILDDVSWETFCTFWEWSYMKEPQVAPYTTLDEVLELGIFAAKYEVRALQHEVSDLLRQKVSRKEWKLGPSQVRRMLSCEGACEWLRPLVYACLCTIVVPQGPQEKGLVEEWLGVLEEDGRLAREWKRSDFLKIGPGRMMDGGPCRFHDHGLVDPVEGRSGVCPYQKAELYPPTEIGKGKGKGKNKGPRRVPRIIMEVSATATPGDRCAEESVMEDEVVVVEGEEVI